MRHSLSKEMFKFWKQNKGDGQLPPLSAFTPEAVPYYTKCGLLLKLQEGEIILAFMGSHNNEAMTSDLNGRPLTDLSPPALKSMQMSLLMPCFKQGLGMVRSSRVWYGHRHKDVEWLLLPVRDDETGDVVLIGLSLTFVEPDKRDYVSVGSVMVERIIRQNFLSLGQNADLSVIDSHGWAVLDTMGAKISIDGERVQYSTFGISGDAGLVAAKVSTANVLAVANPSEFGQILSRLGARYNLKIVETFEEAREILERDMIDVLVTTETVNDVAGLSLIEEAQRTSAFTACVMMLDQRDEAEDTRVLEGGKFVQCLVKPVGEFALRKAVDDANEHAVLHLQEELKRSHI